MTLRSQILALAAIPLVALLVLQANRLIEARTGLARESHAVEQTRVSVALGELVHYMQVERGQSAGFLASKGKNFANDLPDTRAQVDTALAALSGHDFAALAPLARLQEVRSAVTQQSYTIPEMAKFYTSTINSILATVSENFVMQSDARLVQLGSGMVSLMFAKEAAGLQRAAGAGGFGRGEFNLGTYSAFLTQQARETKLLETSLFTLKSYFPQIDLSVGLRESGVQEARDAVLSAGPGGTLPDLTAPQWFAKSTAWISFLRGIEVDVAERTMQIATASAQAAQRVLYTTIAVTLGLIVICLALAGLVVNVITKQFRALQTDLDRLACKEFDFEPAYLSSKNEIGQLNRAMDVTRQALAASESKLKNIEASRIADRGAVIGTLDGHMDRLANRDLGCSIYEVFPEEYEPLRSSFNYTVETLSSTITDVSDATRKISDGAQGICEASSSLSQRTATQAATLEQAAAAMEELTVSVRETAKSAAEVEETVMSAKESAVQSEEVVQSAIDAMGTIEKSSMQISKITEVIDDIAFQTNLLALNAGVEAARAGAAGKGFAVVAAEVQGLAHRSSAAAADIKTLIADSTSQVEQGAQLVGKTGDALNNIATQVDDISRLVAHIASAAQQQSSGLTEINSGIEHLDVVTQENAAMAMENTQIGERVNVDAQNLNDLMARFNTTSHAQDGAGFAPPESSQPGEELRKQA